MQAVLDDVARVAPRTTTVLVTGPSGAGKEMVARLVHDLSPRKAGPFVSVNCAAVPDGLIESELFGYEKGAFTGAVDRHRGAFEQADRGTLFLDEIGDAAQRLHTKLLRVLEERAFTRVGGEEIVSTDVRVVAATSKDLEAEVAAGRFREELFYRLDVFRVRVPGLDERPGDVEKLALHFLAQFAADGTHPISGFTPEALEYLRSRRWPGNVRQLRNVVEAAAIRCDGDLVTTGDLVLGAGSYGTAVPRFDEEFDRVTSIFLREYCSLQLRRANGSVTRAAALSGLPRNTFVRKLRKVGLDGRKD